MEKKQLEIKTEIKEDTAEVALIGRLDSLTSTVLEQELDTFISDVTFINFDFADLVYISSAGLRTLIATNKIVSRKKGKIRVVNCSPEVKEVFDITGFTDILEIS